MGGRKKKKKTYLMSLLLLLLSTLGVLATIIVPGRAGHSHHHHHHWWPLSTVGAWCWGCYVSLLLLTVLRARVESVQWGVLTCHGRQHHCRQHCLVHVVHSWDFENFHKSQDSATTTTKVSLMCQFPQTGSASSSLANSSKTDVPFWTTTSRRSPPSTLSSVCGWYANLHQDTHGKDDHP